MYRATRCRDTAASRRRPRPILASWSTARNRRSRADRTLMHGRTSVFVTADRLRSSISVAASRRSRALRCYSNMPVATGMVPLHRAPCWASRPADFSYRWDAAVKGVKQKHIRAAAPNSTPSRVVFNYATPCPPRQLLCRLVYSSRLSGGNCERFERGACGPPATRRPTHVRHRPA